MEDLEKGIVKNLVKEYCDMLWEGNDVIWSKLNFITPRHGSCCTCGTCGYSYDDCCCNHNEIIDILEDLGVI